MPPPPDSCDAVGGVHFWREGKQARGSGQEWKEVGYIQFSRGASISLSASRREKSRIVRTANAFRPKKICHHPLSPSPPHARGEEGGKSSDSTHPSVPVPSAVPTAEEGTETATKHVDDTATAASSAASTPPP